jgi:beta-xylosidase
MEIKLDLTKARPGPPLMTGDLGYDEYAGTLTYLGYTQLSGLKQAPEGTFRYIRIHNIFSSKEGDNRGARDAGGDPVRIGPDGTITYDWILIDGVCDAILSVGCIPFLELGFTPTPWSTMDEILAKEDLGELRWKVRKNKPGSPACYPPKNYELWDQLVTACLRHLQTRFGDSVKNWPVELWNEPDIGYFKGTIEQYCDLWSHTMKICKSCGMTLVGGPGLAGGGDFLGQYLNYCLAHHCVPDFISYHVKAGHEPDLDKEAANTFVMWSRFLRLRDAIPPECRHLPIWITEFDPITGCECGIVDGANWAFHNKAYYPAWLGKSCCVLAAMQQSIGLDDPEPDPDIGAVSFAAIFNDNQHITAEPTPFYGARVMTTPFWVERVSGQVADEPPMMKKIRELNARAAAFPALEAAITELNSRMYYPPDLERYELKALPKPIFRAFEYTRFLRGDYVPFGYPDDNIFGVIAKDGIFLNLVLVNQPDPIAPGPKCTVAVRICGLPPDVPRMLDSVRIDSTSANPYETWLEMGSPMHLTRLQWDALEAASHPQPVAMKNYRAEQGKIRFELSTDSHSFHFIRWQWP